MRFYQSVFQNIGADCKKSKNAKTVAKQLNFLELFDQYADNPIVENWMVNDSATSVYGCKIIPSALNIDKNCLISLVKSDNFEHLSDSQPRYIILVRSFQQQLH